MSKFDDKKLKLRRAFSLESIREEAENSDWLSDEEDDQVENLGKRRYSYPLSPKTLEQVPSPQFQSTLVDI